MNSSFSLSDHDSDTIEDKKRRVREYAAIKAAAEMKQQLNQSQKKERELKAKLNRLEESIDQHADHRDHQSADLAVDNQQLKYLNMKLAKELSTYKDKHRNNVLTTRAKLITLTTSLEQMEAENLSQQKNIKKAIKAIHRTVLDFKRHIGSHGYNAIPSHTAKILLERMINASKCLKLVVDESIALNTSLLNSDVAPGNEVTSMKLRKSRKKGRKKQNKFRKLKSESEEALWTVGVKEGNLNISGSSPMKKLAKSVSKIGHDIEMENIQLRSKVEMLSNEVKVARKQVMLIPKYRSIITDLRNSLVQSEEDKKKATHGSSKTSKKLSELKTQLGDLESKCKKEQSEKQSLSKQLLKTEKKLIEINEKYTAAAKMNEDLRTENHLIKSNEIARLNILQKAAASKSYFDSNILSKSSPLSTSALQHQIDQSYVESKAKEILSNSLNLSTASSILNDPDPDKTCFDLPSTINMNYYQPTESVNYPDRSNFAAAGSNVTNLKHDLQVIDSEIAELKRSLIQ